MRTQVSILHHGYPSRIRETVDAKLRLLERHSARIVSIDARLERRKAEHRVEIVANVAQRSTLVADARADAFGGALDQALGRMSRMLERSHEKRTSKRRRLARR